MGHKYIKSEGKVLPRSSFFMVYGIVHSKIHLHHHLFTLMQFMHFLLNTKDVSVVLCLRHCWVISLKLQKRLKADNPKSGRYEANVSIYFPFNLITFRDETSKMLKISFVMRSPWLRSLKVWFHCSRTETPVLHLVRLDQYSQLLQTLC